MLRGLKRALAGRRGAGGAADASRHTDRSAAPSAAPSDGTVHLFALDEGASQHAHAAPCGGAGAAEPSVSTRGGARGGAIDNAADDSVRQRQAAAAQRRVGRLDPRTAAYQVSVLLSLSTFFEHKLQADATRAMDTIRAEAAAATAAAAAAAAAAATDASGDAFEPSGGASDDADDSASLAAGLREASCASVASHSGGRNASARSLDVARVALALSRWGYTLIVRRVLHSKTYWTKSFDNTFIVALDTSNGLGVEYIVDPHFRELFKTGAMSRNYSAVWDVLPPVFVGMPCQLQPVVQTLCEEVELSFLEAGRPCPPWRSWAATINRWMSDSFVDVPVPGSDASDAEIAVFLERCAPPAAPAAAAATASAGASPAGSAAAAAAAAAVGAPGNCASQPIAVGGRGSRGGAASTVGTAASAAAAGTRGARTAGVHPSDVSCATASSTGGAHGRLVQAPLRAQVGFSAPGGGAAGQPPTNRLLGRLSGSFSAAPAAAHQQQQSVHISAPCNLGAPGNSVFNTAAEEDEEEEDDFAVVYAAGSADAEALSPCGLGGASLAAGSGLLMGSSRGSECSQASTFLDEEDEGEEEDDYFYGPEGSSRGQEAAAGAGRAVRTSLLTTGLQQRGRTRTVVPAAAWAAQQQLPQQAAAGALAAAPLLQQQLHLHQQLQQLQQPQQPLQQQQPAAVIGGLPTGGSALAAATHCF